MQATAPAVRAEWTIGVALMLAGCSNIPNPVDWNREPTYFFAFGSEPQSFDPSVSYNSGDAAVMDPVYPSYFRYNFLKQNPWELDLDVGLAAPLREPLDGIGPRGVAFHGETWTFEIRHDLRFQDDPCFAGGKGRPVIADDVVYAFKRMADPKVEFPLASNLADKCSGGTSTAAASSRPGPTRPATPRITTGRCPACGSTLPTGTDSPFRSISLIRNFAT